MSQVKLIVQEGFGSENRPYLDRGKVIELDLRVPETHSIIGVIRTDFDKEKDGSKRASDDIVPVIAFERVNNLVGRILTLVDLAFSDPEQRKAAKDLFKQVPWDWYMGHTEHATEAWRLDKSKGETN